MTVYFIKSGITNGNIKIGTSRDPDKRAKGLTLPDCEVLAEIAGGREAESRLHERFANSRIGDSEWFRESPELLAFIKSNKGEPVGVAELWKRAGLLYGEVMNCEQH